VYSLFVFVTGFVTGYVAKNGVKHGAKLVYSAAHALSSGAERVLEDIQDARVELEQELKAVPVSPPAK
jgi:hypothetical protein